MTLPGDYLHHLARHRELRLHQMEARVLPVLTRRQRILPQLPAKTLRTADRPRPLGIELFKVLLIVLLRDVPLAQLLKAMGDLEHHRVAQITVDLDRQRLLIELDRLVVIRRRGVEFLVIRLARHLIAELDQHAGQPLLPLRGKQTVRLRFVDRLRFLKLLLLDQHPALQVKRLAVPFRILELLQHLVAGINRSLSLFIMEQRQRPQVSRIVFPAIVFRSQILVEQAHRLAELFHLKRLLRRSKIFLRRNA